MGLGERKSPSCASDLREFLQYVEGLNDARTMHGKRRVSARRGWAGEKGDFFSTLLGQQRQPPGWRRVWIRRGVEIPRLAVVVSATERSSQTVLFARRKGSENNTHASLLLPERAVSEDPRSTGAGRPAWVPLSVGVNKVSLVGV